MDREKALEDANPRRLRFSTWTTSPPALPVVVWADALLSNTDALLALLAPPPPPPSATSSRSSGLELTRLAEAENLVIKVGGGRGMGGGGGERSARLGGRAGGGESVRSRLTHLYRPPSNAEVDAEEAVVAAPGGGATWPKLYWGTRRVGRGGIGGCVVQRRSCWKRKEEVKGKAGRGSVRGSVGLTLSREIREKFLGGTGGRGVIVVGVIGVSLIGSSATATRGTPWGMEKHSTGEGRRSPSPPRPPSPRMFSRISSRGAAMAKEVALATDCDARARGALEASLLLAGKVARNRLSLESLLWK